MSEQARKYDHYIITETKPAEDKKSLNKFPGTIFFSDDSVIPGSQLFWALMKKPGDPFASMPHGPHTHKTAEAIVIMGINPKDPFDLGGSEVEMCMGPEMEKYMFTRSSFIFIPANFVHCPITYKIVTPFIFLQVQYNGRLTEKSFKQLLPESEREQYVGFNMDGTESSLHEAMAKQGKIDPNNLNELLTRIKK